jgi:hypothetical protein
MLTTAEGTPTRAWTPETLETPMACEQPHAGPAATAGAPGSSTAVRTTAKAGKGKGSNNIAHSRVNGNSDRGVYSTPEATGTCMGSNIPGTLTTAGMLATSVVLAASTAEV